MTINILIHFILNNGNYIFILDNSSFSTTTFLTYYILSKKIYVYFTSGHILISYGCPLHKGFVVKVIRYCSNTLRLQKKAKKNVLSIKPICIHNSTSRKMWVISKQFEWNKKMYVFVSSRYNYLRPQVNSFPRGVDHPKNYVLSPQQVRWSNCFKYILMCKIRVLRYSVYVLSCIKFG